MSDNPLEMTPEREQRIRERAFHLWQSEGEPHGHDLEYWERARELTGMEESAGAGQINPKDSRAEVIEEASLQENLGEFPDRSSDQGEWRQTPMTKDERHAARAPDAQPTRGDSP